MLKLRSHKIKTDHKVNADQVDLSREDSNVHHRTVTPLRHHQLLPHLPEILIHHLLPEIPTLLLQQEDQAAIGKVCRAKRIINSQFA